MVRFWILILLTLNACSSDQQEQSLANEDLETTEDQQAGENLESQQEDYSQYNGNYEEDNSNYNQQGSENSDTNQYGNETYDQDLSDQDFNQALAGENQGENNQLFGNDYSQNDYNQNNQDAYNENQQTNNQNINNQDSNENAEEDEEIPMVAPIGEPNEFSGAPATPNTLRFMAEGEAPEEYIVEYGDTLFDICSQLLGEGGYWPKLWSLNNYIKNPHFIWPGMRLRFYPGDEEDPPFIEILQGDEVVPIADGDDVDVDALVAEVVLPENETLEMLETEVIGRDDIEEAPDIFETVGSPYNADQISVTLPGFIFAEENPASCMVLGGTLGEALVGEDRPFICDPEETLELGSTYTAIRYSGSIEDIDSGSSVGHQYQYVAQVKMTRELDGGEKYIGVVSKSRLGLREGDIIVPYLSTKRRLSLSRDYSNPAVADATAHIVGFDLLGQQIGGQGNLVFLDKGSNDGVSKGQLMKIEQSLQYFLLTYDIENPTADTVTVGYVRIIDTTDVASIGYIVYNDHEVFLGDYVGKS